MGFVLLSTVMRNINISLPRKHLAFPLPNQQILIILFLGIFLLLGYSGTIPYPFYLDDIQHIVHNPAIRVTNLSPSSLFTAVTESYAERRPVANLTLAINYYLGHQNPAGYRFINLIIHFLNGILVYLLLSRTCKLSIDKNCSETSWAPLLGTLLWFIHPVQIESVTYIIQRMTSMAVFFYLASLLIFIQGHDTQKKLKKYTLFSLSFICGLLAVGSKEIALTLPIIIFLYHSFFLRSTGKISKKYVVTVLLLTSVALSIPIFLSDRTPVDLLQGTYATRDFTLIQRLLTEPRIIFFYFSLLLYPNPNRLNLDHDFVLSHGLLLPPQTLFSILGCIAIIGYAIISRKNNRILSFAILWFFINLALESSLIGLELLFEHRLYLPSLFLGFALVLQLEKLPINKVFTYSLLAVILTVFTYWTHERNTTWENKITFWEDAVLKSPNKSRPHGNLGYEYFTIGDMQKALQHSRKAIELDPNNTGARDNLGVIMGTLGHHDTAISIFRQNLRIEPNQPNSMLNLAYELHLAGKTNKAIDIYEKLLSVEPEFTPALVNLADLLIRTDKPRAIRLLTKAFRVDPHNSFLLEKIGKSYFANGLLEQAEDYFTKALQINPDLAGSQNNLGVLFMQKKQYEKAQMHFLAALKLKPSMQEARLNLGAAAVQVKKSKGEKISADDYVKK